MATDADVAAAEKAAMRKLSKAQLVQRHVAPIKSGAQAGPLVLGPRAAEIASYLRSVTPIAEEADEAAILLLSMTLARIERAEAWLDANGVLDSEGNPQPVTRVLSGWMNTAGRMLDRLALTPTSRSALGLDLVRAQAVQERSRDLSGLSARELAELRALVTKAERNGND